MFVVIWNEANLKPQIWREEARVAIKAVNVECTTQDLFRLGFLDAVCRISNWKDSSQISSKHSVNTLVGREYAPEEEPDMANLLVAAIPLSPNPSLPPSPIE